MGGAVWVAGSAALAQDGMGLHSMLGIVGAHVCSK